MNKILEQIKNFPSHPGVYVMRNDRGEVIYVGKAKNLKKRISSYFSRKLDNKTLQLIKQLHTVEVTVTRNEREALLLESNLIKKFYPRYNVVFRDDKSYPYLYLSTQDTFPRLSFHRGEKLSLGKYYGPYPNASLAREALARLQHLFKIRQCDNAFFKSRTRPCLQYQIERCTAPCVGYIDAEAYRQDVQHAQWFLEGKSQVVLERLIQEMEKASNGLQYERAAKLRDEIAILRKIQEQQIIVSDKRQGKNGKINVDVLGLATEAGSTCLHLLMIREGMMLGGRSFFPNVSGIEEDLLTAFMTQHYLTQIESEKIPDEIIVSVSSEMKNNSAFTEFSEFNEFIESKEILRELLQEISGRPLKIEIGGRGIKNQWLEMAVTNAKQGLKFHKHAIWAERLEALAEVLQLEGSPNRVECFDVSHTMGEAAVASCVVFEKDGPQKSEYRRFNIREAKPGDDYGALKEAVMRRFQRLKEEEALMPDLLLIDGGKGQVNQAKAVLRELQVEGVSVVGVSKGPGRKPGLETLHVARENSEMTLPADSKALHLIQFIRDEAHRFAIQSHRKKLAKSRRHSRLEEIPGIGAARRLAILKHFGGLQEVLAASIDELASVPGISRGLAERIYQALHGE